MRDNRLLTGPVAPGLARLALPIMAGMFLQTAFNLVDTWFVSKIGPEAIAAVSMNIPLFFIVLALGSAVAVGTSSLVAQGIGAGDMGRASGVAAQAGTLALVVGIVTAIAGTALARPLLELMGARDLALEYAVDYTRIILAGNPIFFLYAALDGVLRGEGDMKTSTLILAAATVANIILDPIFIFGWGPIPALGVGGAALATMIARGLGLIAIITHFAWGRSSIKINFLNWHWHPPTIFGIFQIGIPTSISQAMISLTMFIYNYLGNQFGDHVVAALGLGFRIDSLAFMPGMAVAIATVTMVGQNFGAKLYPRVLKVWRTAMVMVFASMGGVGLIIILFARHFVALFTEAPAVVEQTMLYLRIIPWFYGFLGMGICTSSAFQGIGRGFPALLVNLLRLGLIGIPLAFLFVHLGWGPAGLWWAFAMSDLTFGLVGITWFSFVASRLFQRLSEPSQG